ncbi:MAG: type IX secretion system membrane protein PorP/SprF [Bacteroidota bacterium]
MIKKITLLFLLIGGLWSTMHAQQDPMFTKYMFNSLAFNPAFAGSPEYMSVRLLYRNQWWALDGAPTTESFTIHSPFKERVGLGLSVINDEIGATGSTSAFASYAYRIPFGAGKLSIGLQAGVVNWRANWDDLQFKDPRSNDFVYFNEEPNSWLPNFGFGLFYYTPKFYVGASVPRLVESDLTKEVPSEISQWARLYRHFFFTAGAAIPLAGDAMIFKPSILIKSVGLLGSFSADPSNASQIGAPTEFDIDVSVLFYDALWVGLSFRSAFEARQFGGRSSFDSIDLWAAFYLQNGTRVGLAYDYTLNQLQSYVQGSLEVMVGYDFSYRAKKVNTPRYF